MFAKLTSKVDAFFTSPVHHDQPNVAKPDFNTQMAVERTLLAHERTLMAWVRTAASLISFGFTIYKFFQLEANGRVPTSQIIGPRAFASIMILMGLFALAIATSFYGDWRWHFFTCSWAISESGNCSDIRIRRHRYRPRGEILNGTWKFRRYSPSFESRRKPWVACLK